MRSMAGKARPFPFRRVRASACVSAVMQRLRMIGRSDKPPDPVCQRAPRMANQTRVDYRNVTLH